MQHSAPCDPSRLCLTADGLREVKQRRGMRRVKGHHQSQFADMPFMVKAYEPVGLRTVAQYSFPLFPRSFGIESKSHVSK